MILYWHKLKEGEKSRELLEQALLAYCLETGKRKPRKKNRGVAEGTHGKPYFAMLPSVCFSISHSGGYWVCLFDKHPCGADIEGVTRKRANASIVRRQFTEEEQALFGDVTAADFVCDEATFLRVWTRKEAYLKYTGEGLHRSLTSFSVAEKNSAGEPVFRDVMEPFYEEKAVILEEIDFSSVTDADGNPLPLIGAVCGTWSELTVAELPEKEEGAALEEAKEIALSYIETRERTEAEVRKKLTDSGIDAERTEAVIAFLCEYGYVNDEAFAERFTEIAAEKGYGPVRIERDLYRKGIAKEAAKKALEPYYFRENAYDLALSVYEQAGEGELDEKLSAKILRRLASHGFTAQDSYQALDDLRHALREEDDDDGNDEE